MHRDLRPEWMLKSYEGIFENGQVTWVAERPTIESARVIVTVLEGPVFEGNAPRPKRRTTSPVIAGKGKTLGDLVSPIVDEYDWGEAGIPECRPVRFVPGEGLIVD
jgi:hypothetical protein